MNNLTLKSLNVKEEIVTAFNKAGYTTLSEVQEKTIPIILRNENVLVISETGSGKTFSYLLPILNNIDMSSKSVEAIIVVPTTLLLDQIKKVVLDLISFLNYDSSFVKTLKSEKDFSKASPKIVITTPHLYKNIFSHYPTDKLKNVIVDEADMLIFDGFSEIIKILKRQIDKSIVSIFSASIKSQDIKRIKTAFKIKNIVQVSSIITTKSVNHHLVDYLPLDKNEALYLLLNDKLKFVKCIVFTSSIDELKEVSIYLKDKGIKFSCIHGDLDKREIKQVITSFDKMSNGILLSSDFSSRGVDINGIDCIISYSLPSDLDYYFHRAGRTGRFFTTGDSYLLIDKDDEDVLAKIRTLIKRNVKFEVLKLSKNELKVLSKSYIFKNLGKKDQSNDKLQKKIRHEVNKLKSEKVKPNYKKKVSKAVSRVKEKHRMKVVRTNIAKNGGNAKDFHREY